MSKEPEIRVKFEIGDIKFEAEGSADLVERERSIFNTQLLPSAVDALVRTRSVVAVDSYNDIEEQQRDSNLNSIQQLPDTGLTPSLPSPADFSRLSLASFVNTKGAKSHSSFILCAAYYNEQKNGIKTFSSTTLKESYTEARKPQPKNLSDTINKLAAKGLIMEDNASKGANPKLYVLSSEGEEAVINMTPKGQKKTAKVHKNHSKEKSAYSDINIDELHLDKYPSVKQLKKFKEKMMTVLYIVTNEKKGEWFTTNDVLCLLTDIFGESATIKQVQGVFSREKTWFKIESVDGNSKEVKRRLLNQGIDYVKSLLQ